jgi:hypothetical protein
MCDSVMFLFIHVCCFLTPCFSDPLRSVRSPSVSFSSFHTSFSSNCLASPINRTVQRQPAALCNTGTAYGQGRPRQNNQGMTCYINRAAKLCREDGQAVGVAATVGSAGTLLQRM